MLSKASQKCYNKSYEVEEKGGGVIDDQNGGENISGFIATSAQV